MTFNTNVNFPGQVKLIYFCEKSSILSKEYQYTSDGTDAIYNGWASWVYYEEILGRPSRYRAFWWSPDSKQLAFYRFDDSKVPVFPLYNAEGVHGIDLRRGLFHARTCLVLGDRWAVGRHPLYRALHGYAGGKSGRLQEWRRADGRGQIQRAVSHRTLDD